MNIKAYAKINLTLDILGVRADGFHELRSIFMPISLCDSLTVEKSDAMSFYCDIPELRGEDNFCVRACKEFFNWSGIDSCASVKLQKHLPYPAGLGGGSADAAAVLNALNAIFGNPLSKTELLALGAEIGSDVPFCLLGTPALCEGRGELITPLGNIPKLYVTVAIGSGRLPTADVFKAYDESNAKPTDSTDKFLVAHDRGDTRGMIKAMGNAFTDVCARLCPETREMRTGLLRCGAESAMLSGSGPAVYGVFFTKEKAMAAARDMRAKGFFAVDCETLTTA